MKRQGSPLNPILVVDDEEHALKSFELTLRSSGLGNIISCSDGRKARDILRETEVEMILLDLVMPGLSGEEFLMETVGLYPDIPVIVVTGTNDVDTAVRCMQRGAFDYVLKPLKSERLLPAVRRAIEIRQLRRENDTLSQCFFSEGLKRPEHFSKIVTQAGKMLTLFRYCEAVARGPHPILITGETGVGKELVAEAIHMASGRPGDLVAINVAGLDDSVFSDTLFGHVRGAFTDAATVRSGQIERAAGGTLFLDEIGDLSMSSQVKLLRLLDKNEYFPLGSDTAKLSGSRYLFATHRDLPELVKAGKFREDLFYRLRTHRVHVPSLRERRDDIPLLVDHFIDKAAREFGRKRPSYPAELLVLFRNYGFPGNVRELRSMIFDAVGTHQSGVLSTESFRTAMWGGNGEPSLLHPAGPTGDVLFSDLEHIPTLREATDSLIHEALVRAKNNQRVAALMLGITPQALSQRLKKRA